jgi:CrcB protein
VTVHALVFHGAGLGRVLRHSVNLAAARLLGTGFPYGTLTANVLGSPVMGFLAGSLAFKGEVSQHWWPFLTTGVLGGFTTFSAFSLDAVLLWERGDTSGMLAYILASGVLSVGGLFAGLYLVRQPI